MNEVIVPVNEEQALSRQVTSIEARAASLVVTNDAEYGVAAEFGKTIKNQAATVMEFFKPMKESAHQAHKAICDREKTMLTPLKNAEAIIKKTMGGYVEEKERERKAQEEALRLAAARERERLLSEAAEKSKAGDEAGAEETLNEAVLLDQASSFTAPAVAKPKVAGVSTRRDWEIVEVDESVVPVNLLGMVLRPVNESAVRSLIRSSKGTIQIPGVKYKEVTDTRFRR